VSRSVESNNFFDEEVVSVLNQEKISSRRPRNTEHAILNTQLIITKLFEILTSMFALSFRKFLVLKRIRFFAD